MDEVGLIHREGLKQAISNFWKAYSFLRSLKHRYRGLQVGSNAKYSGHSCDRSIR